MADDEMMDQDGIEQLLNAGKDEAAPPTPPPEPPAADSVAEALDQSEIESLLSGGSPPSADAQQPQAAATPPTPTPQPPQLPQAATALEAEDGPLGQGGVEQLLQQAGTALGKPGSHAAGTGEPVADSHVGEGSMLPGDIDFLLRQAEQALESVNTAADEDLPQDVSAYRLEELCGAAASTESATFDLIRDVELDLRIELGRTHMYLEDVLKLRKGAVVPLDKLAGDPVDIYVNGRLIARGEVLVLSDNFCVRIAELISGTTTPA